MEVSYPTMQSRFEHCYLRLPPPNHCQHPSGCNNFTHVRCAALWSLKNRMTIDDPKSVGLWCREHYYGYSKNRPSRRDWERDWLQVEMGTKQEQTLWSEPDIQELKSNGLWFAPTCTDCFLVHKYIGIGEKLCSHPWKEHQLITTGEYILFPSNWFHRGYFNRRWRSVYIQAQLFAVPSGNQRMDWSTCSLSQGNKFDYVDGMLYMSTIRELSQDLLNYWDKHYPAPTSNLAKHSRVYMLVPKRQILVTCNGYASTRIGICTCNGIFLDPLSELY